MSSDVPQSRSELEQHLQDHLGFLHSSSDAYDAGRDGEAKRLAVSLRVLLHDTRNSASLLGQLNRLGAEFLSTAIPYNEHSKTSHAGLVFMGIGADNYLAMLDDVPFKNWMPFSAWWNEVVFVDDKRQQISRKQLVLSVADQDGGAHVDPSLNETYARLSRDNSLGWVAGTGGERRPIQKPERAAIRQICHEVLATLISGYKKSPKHTAGPIVGGTSIQVGSVPTIPRRPRKIGRNERCPCGSGRKYKQCHGSIAT